MGIVIVKDREGREEHLGKRGVRYYRSKKDPSCLIIPLTTPKKEVENVCVLPLLVTRVRAPDALAFVPGADADWTTAPTYFVRRTQQGAFEWSMPTAATSGKLGSLMGSESHIEPPGDEYEETARCAFDIIERAAGRGMGLDDEYVPEEVPEEWLVPIREGGSLITVQGEFVELLTNVGEALVVADPRGNPLKIYDEKQTDTGYSLVFRANRAVEIRADAEGRLSLRKRRTELAGASGRQGVVVNDGLSSLRGPWTGTIEDLAKSGGLACFSNAASAAIHKAKVARATGTACDAVREDDDGRTQWVLP